MVKRLSPHILLTGAEKYLESAKAVCKPPITERERFICRASFPAYFLVGHSIELSLKAFLLAKGVGISQLRNKFGHDLAKLISECRRRKLGRQSKLSKNQVRDVKLLGFAYKSKLLEYIEVGTYSLPQYWIICEIAATLIHDLKPFCYFATFNKELPKSRR
jgi:hypothetical protein